MDKAFYSALAIALTLVAFAPYVRSIWRGETKPHVFSWLIWGATTFVVFLAQLADRGGAGAWPIGVSGIITLYVAYLAYVRQADASITRADGCFFIAALAALPAWAVTADPLWAVVILTAVDLLGFAPTFRKAWHRPHDEHLPFFVLLALRNIVAITALEHYSLTTVLFPAALALACVLFVAMVAQRRRVLRR
ncbi:MAG TPA: hypothetical protein ENJ19_09500 [Gammaproteobacteria bacterium]|nr:hypothetical protein [Gammaproteobacteria bacterium]